MTQTKLGHLFFLLHGTILRLVLHYYGQDILKISALLSFTRVSMIVHVNSVIKSILNKRD